MKKSVIHNQIYSKMVEKTENINGCIDLNKAKRIITYFGIPKHLTYKVLKEMEDVGLIKKINQKKVKIK